MCKDETLRLGFYFGNKQTNKHSDKGHKSSEFNWVSWRRHEPAILSRGRVSGGQRPGHVSET